MAYYILILLVFNLANTGQSVPYRAMLQDAAPTYGIRTRMVMLQEMIAMFSFMAASFIHGWLIGKFKYPSGQPDYQFGYIVSALIFSPIIAFLRVFTCGFIKETPTLEGAENENEDEVAPLFENNENALPEPLPEPLPEHENHSPTLLESVQDFLMIWVSAIRFRDFSLLSLAWFLANSVLALVQSNIILYTKYYLGKDGYGKVVVLFLQLGIAFSLPLWAFIIRKIGKKKSLFLGCSIISLFFLGFFFLGRNQLLLFLIGIPFAGCCAGSLYICLTAMQPDCVEAYYNKTLKRHEAVLYSLFLLAGKVGSAIAQAVSSYVLEATGYISAKDNPGIIEQPAATLFALRSLMFLAPLVLMILACIIVFFVKDYKKDFSTDRATVSGAIISERVISRRPPSFDSTVRLRKSEQLEEDEVPRSPSHVRWADQVKN